MAITPIVAQAATEYARLGGMNGGAGTNPLTAAIDWAGNATAGEWVILGVGGLLLAVALNKLLDVM